MEVSEGKFLGDDAITGDIYAQCCLLDEAPYG